MGTKLNGSRCSTFYRQRTADIPLEMRILTIWWTYNRRLSASGYARSGGQCCDTIMEERTNEQPPNPSSLPALVGWLVGRYRGLALNIPTYLPKSGSFHVNFCSEAVVDRFTASIPTALQGRPNSSSVLTKVCIQLPTHLSILHVLRRCESGSGSGRPKKNRCCSM